MNLQTHDSGNIAGDVSNQAGNSVPTPSQRSGNIFPPQTQNPSFNRSVSNMDPEILKSRRFMQKNIYEILLKRNQQSPELSNKKMFDIVKRLEEGLFRSASSTEEYRNMATLDNRLHFLINRQPMSNDNQRFSRTNSSPSYGTMIPTPGLSQTSNSVQMTSSVDHSLVSSCSSNVVLSSNFNSGSFSTGNGSSGNVHGPLSSGYQQSTTLSVNTGGTNIVTSMGVQRMASQMIPTPGFNNFSTSDLNSNANNQPAMKQELPNVTGYPAVESSTVSQTMQQRPHVTSQNSQILHNIGGHMGSGIRSTLQQRPYGLSNGSMNGGLGIIGNNTSMMNNSGASEGYLEYENSKPLHGHIDQHNLSMIQGDGYGIGAVDASGNVNLYAPVTSVESMTNKENLNGVALQSITKTNSPRMMNQQTLHLTQQVNIIAQESVNQSEDMSHLSKYPVQEKIVQPYRLQQFQPPSNQLQRQMVQHQPQEELLNQSQLLKNDVACHVSSNIVTEQRSGLQRDNHGEGGQHSQVSESCLVSHVRGQFQQNSLDARVATQFIQTSGQMQQLLHPQHFVANSQNDAGGLSSSGIESDAALSGGWFSNSQDRSHVSGRFQLNQNVQEDCHRLTGEDVAQQNIMYSNESFVNHSGASRSSEPPNSNEALRRSNNINRERQFKNQQRWLLFLRHARRCSAPEGKCQEPNCTMVQKLLTHMECCNEFECSFPRCHVTKGLIIHHRRCRDANCPVCVPVKNFIQSRLKAFCSDLGSGLHNSVNGSPKIQDSGEITGRSVLKANLSVAQTAEYVQPTIKRLKIEHASQSFVPLEESPLKYAQHDKSLFPVKSEIFETKLKSHASILKISHNAIEMKNVSSNNVYTERPDGDYPTGVDVKEVIKIEKEMESSKVENTLIPCENASKSGKPKIKGVSLIELFTPEQVRRHIRGLRQWVGQSKAKAEKNQAMEHLMSENSCQLCAVEKLNFEPPPIYCTPCGTRIKRNAMYYTFGTGEARHCFCIPCYNETRGDTIAVEGSSLPKARMEKKKNDEETEEWWVQCDKCEAWQHQICALFNGRRNEGGQAEYTCPNCYIIEVERGERCPLPQNAVLGAKDLPRTILSDQMEERLFSRLKHERQERARIQGKAYDEVPGAEALVVRVVSSVDKKLEVKPRFFEIFQEQNYSTEFPYKSKVILLFQNIEGVEVCLFGMYVQEFGSECKQPNHRRVYLSYLDSVKYFRPDVKAVTGEALRTFVYHEILIGYLEYCKKRGFTSCYIWACPPLKGEDYILYCHPEIQKTPKSDKLREWYLAMLKKAEKENIVAGLTNLYDHFFVSTGESKAKVTAARLPYFDGDYWPGAAEDIIYQLQQEDSGGKLHKKGIIKKTITKRALKASGQTDLSGNASKDLLLMHKLGETISPMKEDFIMVHLQHACTHCCILMVSGNRWVCRQCKNFQLCDNCYDAEQEREDRERHPINHKDKHALYSLQITGVPDDTKDEDEILESEFFDTRQAFLSLCQGNHYQYDTLRRAKHSSMMVLYHLHNPTAPAFVTTCYVCQLDIEAGQGWRCEICPDYDVCNACYQKDGGIDHPHRLTNNPSSDRDAQNKEARELRVTQLRKMLDLLVHASQCRSPLCQYPNCRKVKGLFRHGMMCKIRVSGGCVLCKKMWYLLQLHARACKESECSVPRCRDLKEHMRRMQQQSDSRRRAAVMEMMRQRAAEVADGS